MSKIKKEYKETINNMVWSFSRLNSWHNCKLGWKKSYLDKYKGVSNGWAKAGSLGHEILEDFANNKLDVTELESEWINRYDNEVTEPFPRFAVNLHEHYKNKVAKYFKIFKGFSGEVKDVELEFIYNLPDGSKFTGFIDLITEMENESIICVDHKISKKFTKKKLEKKAIQLFLYAPAIEEKYDKLPSTGIFHFFQTGESHIVEMSKEKIQKSLLWATDTIEEIKNANSFPPVVEGMTELELKENKMFCTALCNHRETCEAKQLIYRT